MTQVAKLDAPFVLALDVGTSSTRALLFDANGGTVPGSISQRTYKLTTSSQGEVSIDADELVSLVTETINEVLQAAGPYGKQIGAVALDTFWHSLLGIDATSQPLTPVITWEDTRAYGAAGELRNLLDEKAIHARTGARFHASYWPAKLRWLAQSQPEIFARVAEWISFGEYLHRKFLGRSVCSLSMASATGMLAQHTLQWDSELMQVLGIRAEQLPPLGDAHESVRGLASERAEVWPTLRDVPWFPAVGDGATACVGSGCANLENWSLTMGTSSAIRVVVEPDYMVASSGLWLYLIDRKRAVLGAALSEGGNMLNWLCNTLKLPALKDAEPLLASLEPASHGLTILPFISGERSLGWHAEAHMTISGISLHTTSADFLRAGVESLAYQINEVHEELCATLKVDRTKHRLIASGGVLQSSTAIQSILADTLGMAIYPSHDHEASARGAALLALEAMGIIPDVGQIAPVLREPTLPNPEHNTIYRDAAERQRKLYQVLLGD